MYNMCVYIYIYVCIICRASFSGTQPAGEVQSEYSNSNSNT